MTDIFTKAQRSHIMSQIRSKNTQPELLVRKLLFGMGFRYRLHSKDLPGKPDIVLPKYKTVIFVNGCFWHGHRGCKNFTLPKTRAKWWSKKIEHNRELDTKNIRKLKSEKWQVITIYECELEKNIIESTLRNVRERLYKYGTEPH